MSVQIAGTCRIHRIHVYRTKPTPCTPTHGWTVQYPSHNLIHYPSERIVRHMPSFHDCSSRDIEGETMDTLPDPSDSVAEGPTT